MNNTSNKIIKVRKRNIWERYNDKTQILWVKPNIKKHLIENIKTNINSKINLFINL